MPSQARVLVGGGCSPWAMAQDRAADLQHGQCPGFPGACVAAGSPRDSEGSSLAIDPQAAFRGT